MAIEQLLGPVPRAVFIDEHFLKLPFARPGGCRHLVDVGGWEAVGRLLADPQADLIAGREGQRWQGPRPSSRDGFGSLRPRLRSSLRWRQRLPATGAASPLTPEELLGRYRELFTELGRDLAELLSGEEVARAFLAQRERRGRP